MAGSVTGSTIIDVKDEFSKRLNVITVSINNLCNASCEHCYLKYNSKESYISGQTLDKILKTPVERIVVVGKEPFYDKKSIDILKKLVEKAVLNNKKVSVITNGINLDEDIEFLKLFENIDISIHSGDGLYRTEEQFRRILENLEMLEKNSVNNVNILSVIDSKTINSFDSVIKLADNYKNVKRILFSPFIETKRGVSYSVEELELKELLKRLTGSEVFLRKPNAYLLLDIYHFINSSYSIADIENIVEKSGIKHKVKFIKTPPTLMGIVRVSHDGLLMTSYDALHTENYRQFSIPFDKVKSIENYYKNIVSKFAFYDNEIVAIWGLDEG